MQVKYSSTCPFLSYQVSKSSDIEEQERQEAPSVSIQKHCNNKVPGSDGEKKRKGIVIPLNEEPSWIKPVYEIGRPSFVTKKISANTLKELVSTTISLLNMINLIPNGVAFKLGMHLRFFFCQQFLFYVHAKRKESIKLVLSKYMILYNISSCIASVMSHTWWTLNPQI